jgi:AcrR family transcriptional regulator
VRVLPLIAGEAGSGLTSSTTATPRQRLLNTATALLDKEGIQSVGINRLIAEAGVALMTLYRQFGDKETLVAASLEHWSTDWLQWLADELDRRGTDPEARINGLFDALGDWFTSERFHGSFIASAATELRGQPDHPAHRVIQRHRLAVYKLLEDLAGAARSRIPAELATQLQLLMDGAIATAAFDRSRAPAEKARSLALAAKAALRQPDQRAGGRRFEQGDARRLV